MAKPRKKIPSACSWVGWCWSSPLTLLGAVPALAIMLNGGTARRLDSPAPVWLITGKSGDWLLSRHPIGAINAMAIGHLIFVRSDLTSPRIVQHELEHVHQAARWGILFPFAYLIAAVWAMLRGGRAYWDNPFEVAARRAENDCGD